MKERKKTILLLVGLLLALIPAVGVLVMYVGYSIIRENRYYGVNKLASAQKLIESADLTALQAEDWLREDLADNVDLMTYLLGNYVKDGTYTGPRLFEDGMVVEISGENVIYPDDMPEGYITITPELIREGLELPDDQLPRTTIHHGGTAEDDAGANADETGDSVSSDSASDISASGGSVSGEPASGRSVSEDEKESSDSDEPLPDDEEVILSVGIITDGVYYVDWTTVSEVTKYVKAHVDLDEVVATAEESCNAGILLVNTYDPDLTLRCSSSVFPDIKSVSELGIRLEDIENGNRAFMHNGKLYECLYQEVPERMYTIILALPLSMLLYRGLVRSVLVAAFIFLVISAVVFWIMAVRKESYKQNLSPAQVGEYHPRRVKSMARIILIFGCLFIFAVAALIHVLGHIQTETVSQKEMLEHLKNNLVNTQEAIREQIITEETDWCVYYTARAASLIGEDPNLQNRQVLENICEILDFDYIMLFDSNGEEILCNDNYVGFKLSDISGKGSDNFRRLTQGISQIVLEPGEDAISGKTRQLIGVPLPSREGQRHGVMVAALAPDRTEWSYGTLGVNDQLALATPDQNICFAVDEESTRIEYSSDLQILNQTAEEAGLSPTLLKDSMEDFFTVDNKNYYGVSDRNGSLLFYYGIRSEVLTLNALPYALLSAFIFLLIYVVFTKLALAGYTTATYEARHGQIEEDKGETNRFVFDSSRNKKSSPKWTFKPIPWSEKLPHQKTRFFIHCVSAVILLIISVAAVSGREQGRETNLYVFITKGTWTRGFNIFSLCGVLLTFVYVYLAVVISRTVLQTICQYVDSKGETLCRLFFNIIEYLAMLVFLFYALDYVGVNTGTILASLGLVSLALTLGAKDLFADIIAGFFIVFQESFRVGDTVKINNLEGTVQEIGVRSTKLIGQGDNVEIINNSSINQIVNMSRMNSWYAILFSIPSSVSLSHVEEILKKELPRIGAGEPHILSGPVYKGVEELKGDSLTLCVLTECSEKYYNRVKRYVNREIHLLLEREGIARK